MAPGVTDLGSQGREHFRLPIAGVDGDTEIPLIIAGGGAKFLPLGDGHGGIVHQGAQGRFHPGGVLRQGHGLLHRFAGGLADVVVVPHEVAPALAVPGGDKYLGPVLHGFLPDIAPLLVPKADGSNFGGPVHLEHG